jgi:hypothetical protein
MPGVWDALTARLGCRGRLPHRVPQRLLRQRHAARVARLRIPHADRDGGGGSPGVRGQPRARCRGRRRHGVRQPAQHHSHRRAVAAGRRLGHVPRRPGVAEEVRPHGGQAGGRARRLAGQAARSGRTMRPGCTSLLARTPGQPCTSRKRSNEPRWHATPAWTRCSWRPRSRSPSSNGSHRVAARHHARRQHGRDRSHAAAHTAGAGRASGSGSSSRRSPRCSAMVKALQTVARALLQREGSLRGHLDRLVAFDGVRCTRRSRWSLRHREPAIRPIGRSRNSRCPRTFPLLACSADMHHE